MRNTSLRVFELMPPLVETDMDEDFKGQKMMQPEALARDLSKAWRKTNMRLLQASQAS